MLAVENLSKQFGGLRAVDGCSFAVQSGTITGLIGPNGAGKTTVFNLLTGFFRPNSGRVLLQDMDITGLPPYRIFQKGIARTFQIPREFKEMTVMENLMLAPLAQSGERLLDPFLRPRRVRRQERTIAKRASQVLEFVGLDDLRDELSGNLSGGQKKLLELAKTMMIKPQLVMLDEPGAGVNRTLLKRIAESIERLREEEQTTFLLIEHDMDFVMRLCNPVIVMSEGKKLVEGNPDEVQRNEQVLEAYLGGQYAAVDS
ncbi:MAG: ABC transporter ATP-binding protein [Candidatus Bipolaricaulota bacterium]|nr:ABC transporter ATP-binding protein [Candidatus Bipolaricaulota bacterium]